MLPTFKSKVIASVTALALATTAAAPAQALGKNERNFLKGVAAAAIVGLIINESQKSRRAQPQVVYRDPAPQVTRSAASSYDAPTYRAPVQQGRIIGSTNSGYGSGLDQTPASRVFNSYTAQERRDIQRQLARFGYYDGSIDGAFGPRTHQAVYEFARAGNKTEALNSTSGAFAVYDALLA